MVGNFFVQFFDVDNKKNKLKSSFSAKLLYKKLNTISSRKRREILHVSIMEMVRQAQEEDERERGGGINTSVPPPNMNN